MEIGSSEKKYKLLKTIGEGGMGKVYEALEYKTKKRRAVKQIQVPANCSFEKSVSRFKREYLFLRSLHHENIVKAYDFFTEDNNAFMVLQYVQGLSLRDYIRDRSRSLSIKEQLAICLQIIRAVEYINTTGVLHRDIKPANIIVNEAKKKATLLDLGIAKNLETNLTKLTRTGEIVGTPSYLSPEQVGGDTAENSDVFSLAVVLYQFLSWQKHSPFYRNNYIATLTAISTQQLPLLHQFIDDSRYKNISIVLQKALEKDSEKRIQTAKQFANLLQQIYNSYDNQKSQWNIPQPLNTVQEKKLHLIGEKYGKDSIFVRRIKRISKRKQKKQTSSIFIVISVAVSLFVLLVLANYSLKPDIAEFKFDNDSNTTTQSLNSKKSQERKNIEKTKKIPTQLKLPPEISKKKTVDPSNEKYTNLLVEIQDTSKFEKWKQLSKFIAKYPLKSVTTDAKKQRLSVEEKILEDMINLELAMNNSDPSNGQQIISKYNNFSANFLPLQVPYGQLPKAFKLLQESYKSYQVKVKTFEKNQQHKINEIINSTYEKMMKKRDFNEGVLLLQPWLKYELAKSKIDILLKAQQLFAKMKSIFKNHRGRKISISLTNGKFTRGYIVKVQSKQFLLKDYKNKVHTIKYTALHLKTLDKFLGQKITQENLYCLSLLAFAQKNYTLCRAFITRIVPKKEDVRELLTQIVAIEKKSNAQKRRVSFLSPQNWLGQKKITLSANIFEINFKLKITGGSPVKQVTVNNQKMFHDEKQHIFTYDLSLISNNVQKINIKIINSDLTFTEYSWSLKKLTEKNVAIFRGSLERSGFYHAVDNFKPRNLKWSFKTKQAIHTSPIGAYNNIYVGSDAGILYAIDSKSGEEKWQYKIGETIYATPVIDKGTVYLGSLKRKLFAINAKNGKKLWDFPIGGNIKSSAIVVNNVIFFASMDKCIYAVNTKTRNLLWKYRTNAGILSSPVIKNNVLYIASKDKNIYALNVNSGSLLWKFTTKREFEYATPAIYGNRIHFGSIDGSFYSLSLDGKQKLRFETPESIYSSPCLVQNVAYFGNKDGSFYAIYLKTGKKIWESQVNNPISTSPIGTSKFIYFTCQDGYIYELDRKTGQQTWSYNIGIEITKSSPMIYHNVLYFGGDNGYLYAFD
ncbi:PQQ-binding-like beta-propeller repeat protein [Candidatus Uabimicrobium sp. HlEnr_7]|uniref:serine/threonine-protein kinase n=1 Tax=Candidatus Uabimicrobium helgolandensis TaxID=3095367 RepID=UPI003555FEE5